MGLSSPPPLRPRLTVCALLDSEAWVQSLFDWLKSDRYALTQFSLEKDFLRFVDREKQCLDCLILENSAALPDLLSQLQAQATFLPVVILEKENERLPHSSVSEHSLSATADPQQENVVYHAATQHFAGDQLEHLEHAIEQAIDGFLKLTPARQSAHHPSNVIEAVPDHPSLMLQQQRLAEKLRERLGYLGVYYKRNPQQFLRHMTQRERQDFLDQLRVDYRAIILNYFSNDPTLNEKIDNFVNLAFFSDVPVAQIVEIHMELMDEFSKQLKLEGRSDEVLLDYRLTLIDAIAHLCEMYRRSIPRES